MAFTYSKLAETTVGAGGTSAITFSNIPQNYTDLVLKLSTRGSDSTVYNSLRMIFNADTTSANYSYRYVRGTGSAANSTNSTASPYIGEGNGSTSTASTFANYEIYIPNYTGNQKKSSSIDIVSENNATEAYTHLTASLWQGVTTINQVVIFPVTGTFLQYSTATLYGIRVEL